MGCSVGCKVFAAATGWESDSFIVLRGRESLLRGEGMDKHTQPSQETVAGTKRPERRKRATKV